MGEINVLIKTHGTHAEIYINGIELDGVIGYEFVHSAKENSRIPRLRIDLQATNVTLDIDRIPELPEIYQPFYTLKE